MPDWPRWWRICVRVTCTAGCSPGAPNPDAWRRSPKRPRTDQKGQRLTGRSLTMAENKRDTLNRLYTRDPRVAPWAGTAHGVLQAVNTYEHHEGIIRGATRAERNMLRTLTGDFAQLDHTSWNTMSQILAST